MPALAKATTAIANSTVELILTAVPALVLPLSQDDYVVPSKWFHRQASLGAGLRSRALFRGTVARRRITMVKHEPEIRRAKAKLYVESCNRQVHQAPWTTGRTNTPGGGGIRRTGTIIPDRR